MAVAMVVGITVVVVTVVDITAVAMVADITAVVTADRKDPDAKT